MNLKAGTLNHRIKIYAIVSDQDSDGNVIESQELFAEVWANVRPASVREFIAAGIAASKITVAVTIRQLAGVKPSMHIEHSDRNGDHVLNIEGVLPDDKSGNEWVTLPCSEILNEDQPHD